MKTTIITLAATVIAMTATAQITETPEGEQLKNMEYCSKGMVPDYTTMQVTRFDQSGIIAHVVRNDNKLYIQDPITHYKVGTWMEGELSADGTKAVFHTPQVFTSEQGVTYYLYRMEQKGTSLAVNHNNTDLVFSYVDGTLTQTDGGYLSITNIDGRTTSYVEYDITIRPIGLEMECPPAEAEHHSYKLTCESQGSPITKTIEVAFSGDDVYVANPTGAADSWMHGTIDGDLLTFPNGQFLGGDESMGCYVYLKAAEGKVEIVNIPGFGDWPVSTVNLIDADAIEFTWNAANRSFSTSQLFLINSSADRLGDSYVDINKASFEPYEEVAATPADPVVQAWSGIIEGFGFGMFAIDMPNRDTEGRFINQDNMYYNVFVDGKPLQAPNGDTDIPWTYTDGQNIQISGSVHSFKTDTDIADCISVQVFYRVGDTVNSSNLVSYDVKANAINDTDANTIVRTDCYNLQGHRVSPSTPGLQIRQITRADGSRQTVRYLKN